MYDVLILGSGPAGLSAAIYAARAGMRFAVIEKEYLGTGQIAYTDRVDNYPGMFGVDGFTLGEKFREHAEQFGTEFIDGEVTGLLQTNEGWQITLSDGQTLQSKAVIYALGAAPRRLDIPGEAEYLGRGVSYCALCDGNLFEGKTIAVIGGGDTALSEALYLSKLAVKVYLIHRRSQFRANQMLTQKVVSADNIELVFNTVPDEIQGNDSVTGIRLTQNNTGKVLDVDGIFVAVGTVPNTAILREIADLNENGYIVADESGVTSAAGLFAAGDVRTKAVRQVITAASDGANSLVSALNYING